LVKRLQGPSGLKEEDGQAIIKQAEPHFLELQKYLEQITGDDEIQQIQETTSSESKSTKTILSGNPVTEIKNILKQMLAIFKQQPKPDNRQELLQLCDSLAELYQNEDGWQKLISVSIEAIAKPQHSYHLLAPVIIKEIKIAGDCLEVGKGIEVTPSQGLEQLAQAKSPLILLNLELESAAKTLTKVFNKQQLSKLVEMLQAAS
jgi:hypothetical protein